MHRIVTDEKMYTCPEGVSSILSFVRADGFDVTKFRITATAADAVAAFYGGVEYRHEWDSENEDGEVEILSQDLTAYCVAGDVIDHRDGSVTVVMRKKTELELTTEALAVAEAAMLEGVNSINE